MNSMNEKVKDYLSSLDIAPYREINDFEISQKIGEIVKESNEKMTGENLYEFLAFELFPRHEEHKSERGTHFGSKMSFRNEEDNTITEYPSLQQITKEAVNYWAKRALEAKHPILVERYADLVYDFSEHVAEKFNYKLAQLTIDNIILICEQNIVQDTYQRQKLHRALSIAGAINNKPRLRLVADTIIKTEQKIAKDNKPGLWGFSFKWLVLENSGEMILSEQEVQNLVQILETRLARFLKEEDPDPWGVECTVNLLAPYYLKNKDTVNTLRILLTLEDAFRRNKRSNSDGLLKVNYLEKLDALYRQNGQLAGMRQHIDRITKELPSASKESLSSMQTVSTQIEIKKEDIEKMLKTIFGDRIVAPKFSLHDVVIRLIGSFILKKEGVKKQLDEHSKQFVFQFIVQQRRLSADGHTEAIIPPINEDYEAHLFNQAFQNVQFAAPFFAEMMKTFKKEFSIEQVADYLDQSPLFVKDEREYLLKGLQAYWEKEYLVASQNFIPYIESAFRRLIAGGGGVTLRPGDKYGGYEYRSLSALLDDGIVNSVFGFDVSFYFKLILTHTLGWNLRNNLAHGINLNSFFRQDVSDRLFHILLLLAQVRLGKPPEAASKSAT